MAEQSPDRTTLGARFLAVGLAGSLALPASPALAEKAAAHHGAESVITVTGRSGPAAPDLFGTVALPVRADRFADGWRRASEDASSSPAMLGLIAPARSLNRRDQLTYVQTEVSRRIRWISDATEWGRHDYWASARETLARGAGDMEDRAILKMQALRALGFRSTDLYLTVGKEKIGGPPITILLVRLDGRFYWLDDWSGPPLPVERRPDFEPILSFSGNASWLHGRRVPPRSALASAKSK